MSTAALSTFVVFTLAQRAARLLKQGIVLWLLGWCGSAFAGQISTTTTLTVTVGGTAATSVQSGKAVVLTATVKAGSTTLTNGIVEFCNAAQAHCLGSHLLATAQLTSAGTATYKFFPAPGTHSYSAIFLPQVSYQGSTSSAVGLTVTGGHTVTAALSSSGSAGNYTLTGTIAGSIAAFPTGTLTFENVTNGNSTVGTAALGPYSSTYAATTSSPIVSGNPYVVGVADFNGDGYPDIAVAVLDQTEVSILLNNQNGTFTTKSTPLLAPISFAFGDFNRDGKMDIAELDVNQKVVILIGDGTGGFTTQSATLSTGSGAQNVVTGDFNGDGYLDIAVSNFNTNSIQIWFGNGDGTFTSEPSLALGTPAQDVEVGDFNGDGKLDLSVTLPNVGNAGVVGIYLGNGDGTFAAGATFPATVYANQSLVGDFNGDGLDDVAIVDSGAPQFPTFLGDGAGNFTAGPGIAYPGKAAYSAVLGDFNGDGTTDVAAGDIYAYLTVLLGDGTGNFIAPTAPLSLGGGMVRAAIAAGDFNQDGIADWAVATTTGNTTIVGISPSGTTASATASITGISLPGSGTVNLDVSYPGDANYSSRTSSQIGLTGSPITTSLSLLADATGSLSFAQPVTLTATLSPSSHGTYTTDGEIVTFFNGSENLGTGTLSSGVASLHLTAAVEGPGTLTAKYPGDANFSATTAPAISSTVTNPVFMTLSFPQPVAAIGSEPTLNLAIYEFPQAAATTANFSIVLPAGLRFLFRGSSSALGGTIVISTDGSTLTASGLTLNGSTSGFSEGQLLSTAALGAQAISVTPVSSTYGNGQTVNASLSVLPGVWVANTNGTLSEFATDGTVVSPTGGYSGNGSPTTGVGINASGNVYSLNPSGSILSEFTNAGAAGGASSAGQAGLNKPTGLAIDGANQIWVSNNDGSLTAFYSPITTRTATGSPPTATSTTGGVTIDPSGNVWVTNTSANSVTEFLGAAVPTQVLAAATAGATEGSRPY